jgi:serine/threonine protein phosphatase PrpC
MIRADVGARSHRGRALPENDDHYLVVQFGRHEETLLTSLIGRDLPGGFAEYAYAAVIADGIGRDGAGAMAARLAIGTLADLELRFGGWSTRIDPVIASEILDRAKGFYRSTHETVLRWYRAHREAGRMGAAMTAIYSSGFDLFVTHVGHSRCYVFRNGTLTQLTRDQTLRVRLENRTIPTPVGPGLEDVRHVLTDSIGAGDDVPNATAEHFRLVDDDYFLLCTNGLSDSLTDREIADALASRRAVQEQCDLLVDRAVANGANDNVTAVLINYRVHAGEATTD